MSLHTYPITAPAHNLRTSRLTPFLKWAGGKEQELRYILPLLPTFENYYEPFVGGGAVFFSIIARHKFINDKSSELVHLYSMVANNDEVFFHSLTTLLSGWQQLTAILNHEATHLIHLYHAYSNNQQPLEHIEQYILHFLAIYHHDFLNLFATLFPGEREHFIHELHKNLLNKIKRMKRLEYKKWKLPDSDILANLESALKSAFYMHIRYLYNKYRASQEPQSIISALFFFIRENAYASMFRYNRRGAFNVPYGGISYNRKDLARKITYMRSSELQSHLRQTVITNMDFSTFLATYPPRPQDFVFLDPPYDSEFSTYAQNEFTLDDQQRLARYLLEQCQARFMLVIKNTPTILNLYQHTGLTIKTFNKRYMVNFQDRNNRIAEHLMITNY